MDVEYVALRLPMRTNLLLKQTPTLDGTQKDEDQQSPCSKPWVPVPSKYTVVVVS
jgi:hypothetical protein